MTTHPPALSALIDGLENGNSHAEYADTLNGAAVKSVDFTPYYLFEAQTYTRNLLYKNREFELILVCWMAGQKSAIHDHSDSECVMCCIEGELRENRYELFGENNSLKPRKELSKVLQPYQSSHINNDIGLHEIVNANDGKSVSLHLYLPSIARCKVYENGCCHEVTSSFNSEQPHIFP